MENILSSQDHFTCYGRKDSANVSSSGDKTEKHEC